jgi:predicted DNA-binding transcriptional regulator AlpA
MKLDTPDARHSEHEPRATASRHRSSWADAQDRGRVVREPYAAEYCGLSEMTMRRMRKDETGPRFIRLSAKLIGYRVCDLDDWLEARASAGKLA